MKKWLRTAAAGGWLAAAGLAGAQSDPLVEIAFRENPRVQAACAAVLKAEADLRAAYGFFDPQAASAAGYASDGRAIPGVGGEGSPAGDAASLQAGVEKAFSPGFYVGAGMAERRLLDLPGSDDLYQTLAGVQVRLPLLRDRGFALWKQDYAAVQAAYDAAAAKLVRVCQDLQRDVEARHIDYLNAAFRRSIAVSAADRARRLVAESEQLVSLKILPRYQVLPARLEAALREELAAQASNAVAVGLRRIEELTGPIPPDLTTQSVDVMHLAAGADLPDTTNGPTSFLLRGEYREALAQLAAEQARLRKAENQERSDLALQAAYTWQAEDDTSFVGTHGIVTDDPPDEQVLLVWRKPLGGRLERARSEASRARIRELREELRAIEWRTASERDVAAANFRAARQRLQLVADAVQSARDALTAEEERFRLGEGSSRQVLDAQKDLTAVLTRRNDIATELLRAQSAYRYAAGRTVPAQAAQRRETP